MNRGRRRGGMGLTGLRDGVKRRLFDPNIVPLKPDALEAVSRLPVLTFGQPKPISHLASTTEISTTDVGGQNDQKSVTTRESTDDPDISLQTELFRLQSTLEFAFSRSPFHHSVAAKVEGIRPDVETRPSLWRIISTDGGASTNIPHKPTINDTGVYAVHLLLMHDEIERWSTGEPLKGIANSLDWYPNELVKHLKPPTKTPISKGPSRIPKKRKRISEEGALDDYISDKALVAIVDLPAGDEALDDGVEVDDDNAKGGGDAAESDTDSEDARWNGEVNEAAAADDDDELDNDYCQAYFDNGEGDISDDGLGGYTVGGDEGGGGGGERDYYD